MRSWIAVDSVPHPADSDQSPTLNGWGTSRYQAAYPDCDLLNADVNADGLVNSFDIDPFVEVLAGGG